MATPKTAREVIEEYEKIQRKLDIIDAPEDVPFGDRLELVQQQKKLLHKFVQGLHPGTAIL